METLMLMQKMGTYNSLHLRFVSIAFIIFENTDTDVDVKCERVYTQTK